MSKIEREEEEGVSAVVTRRRGVRDHEIHQDEGVSVEQPFDIQPRGPCNGLYARDEMNSLRESTISRNLKIAKHIRVREISMKKLNSFSSTCNWSAEWDSTWALSLNLDHVLASFIESLHLFLIRLSCGKNVTAFRNNRSKPVKLWKSERGSCDKTGRMSSDGKMRAMFGWAEVWEDPRAGCRGYCARKREEGKVAFPVTVGDFQYSSRRPDAGRGRQRLNCPLIEMINCLTYSRFVLAPLHRWWATSYIFCI